MQRSRAVPLRRENGKKKRTPRGRYVLLFLASYFVSRCDFRPDENSSVGLIAWVIELPSGSSARHTEKKIRVATSDCTARALNDGARRYRGNFVADNSHGDIIGPSPINGKGSSYPSSPRISSRRILDACPHTHTLIVNSLGPLFRVLI